MTTNSPAFEKFKARRAYVNQICEQLGCTQDSCQKWVFPNEAALDTFECLMDSYDVRANQGSLRPNIPACTNIIDMNQH